VTAHPSTFQLDALALGADDSKTAAHVRECARCAAQLSRVQQALPVPGWVRELGASRRRGGGKWSWLYRWAIASVVVLSAGGVLVRMKPWNVDQIDRGAKGTPSVAVYIKRQGTVSLWDGQAPVQAGDGVQLKVAPRGMRESPSPLCRTGRSPSSTKDRPPARPSCRAAGRWTTRLDPRCC
jgi:hypothetical protein